MTLTRTLGWFLAATLSIAGCADVPSYGSAPIAVVPMNQQWTLSRVGAWAMPVSIEVQPGVSRRITGGSFVLRDDWTWGFSYDYVDVTASGETRGAVNLQGAYAVYGGEPVVVSLRGASTGDTYTARINSDDTIDLTVGAYTFRLVSK